MLGRSGPGSTSRVKHNTVLEPTESRRHRCVEVDSVSHYYRKDKEKNWAGLDRNGGHEESFEAGCIYTCSALARSSITAAYMPDIEPNERENCSSALGQNTQTRNE